MTRTRTVQWAVLAVLAVVVGWALVTGGGSGSTAEQLAERIACPVCDGESVAASQTDVARSMFAQIEALRADGLSDREVLAWFEARYGPEILLDPPADLGGIVLWLVPVLVVGGGVAIALHLRKDREATEEAPGPSSRAWLVVGIVAVFGVAAAFTLGTFLEPRADGTPVTGDLAAPTDLESISDETLAATIASFEARGDVPADQLNGMRLALAERYFEAADYRSAADVFQTVLTSDATAVQRSEALGRLGWILFVNGEEDTAETAFQEALAARSTNGEARYFYALMLLDQGRGDDAVPLLEDLLDDPSVPAELVPDLEAMLEEARA